MNFFGPDYALFSRCAASVLMFISICSAYLFVEFPAANAAETELNRPVNASPANDTPPFLPVYRIPLRVHIGKSGHSGPQLAEIISEINSIWWLQAAICFEAEFVTHDNVMENGADIWFIPVLKEYEGDNGYYVGDHEIYVRDIPVLGHAPHPALSPAARTAAHELGHVLGLHHHQDSDDNLMRSKTFGWKLNASEIRRARIVAAKKSLGDTRPLRCSTVGGR